MRYHFIHNRPASDDRPGCGRVREGVFLPGGESKGPRAVYHPYSEYLEEARRGKNLGVVFLRVTVGTDGLPSDICVARAAGSGLDEKAIEALKSLTFEPGPKTAYPFPQGF